LTRRERPGILSGSPVLFFRKLVALVCIALVVFAAIAPASSMHFTDVLAPLWLVLFPVLPLVVMLRRVDDCHEQPTALLSVLASRAPPLLLPL
jgi:hypothetical protein